MRFLVLMLAFLVALLALWIVQLRARLRRLEEGAPPPAALPDPEGEKTEVDFSAEESAAVLHDEEVLHSEKGNKTDDIVSVPNKPHELETARKKLPINEKKLRALKNEDDSSDQKN